MADGNHGDETLWLLRAVVGPHTGADFPLGRGENPIGRAHDNRVWLHDSTVSGHHAVIALEEGFALLRDMGSRNGVLVNGERVTQARRLREGDRIAIGSSLLELMASDGPDSPRPGQSGEMTLTSEALELLLHDPESYSDQYIGTAGAQALCRLARALTAATELEEMLRDALSILGSHLCARSGIVALSRGHASSIEIASVLDGGTREQQDLCIDSLAREVVERGEALLFDELPQSSPAKSSPNRSKGVGPAPGAAIYAPLRSRAAVCGVVGVGRARHRKFAEEDLRFLALAGDLMGMAAASLQTREQALADCRAAKSLLQSQYSLIGTSPALRSVLDLIDRVAPSDSPVLIIGETGTGKELVARAIHANSPRALRPFVPLNCAVGPSELEDDILFGHVKGAFTGATEDRLGAFERADGGTLFLDEVAELSATSQSKLLRVVEDGLIARVGGREELRVDTRLVCATNRDLVEEVAHGRFREDLYYRLAVVSVRLPALRERESDIPLLAEHFLELYRHKAPRRIEGFCEDALVRIRKWPWPGNVRALRNAVERAILLGTASRISVADLGLPVQAAEDQGLPTRLGTLAEAERAHIRAVLETTGWNQTQAAATLGIDRKTLLAKRRLYGLDKGAGR